MLNYLVSIVCQDQTAGKPYKVDSVYMNLKNLHPFDLLELSLTQSDLAGGYICAAKNLVE